MSYNYLGVAGLLASVIAAIYSALSYHRPRSPKRRSVPSFGGMLPQDGPGLIEFLLRNEGKIVDLVLDVGLTAGGASPDQKNSVVFYDSSDGGCSEHLIVEVDEGAIQRYDYEIEKAELEGSAIGRVTVSLTLRGTFIPRSHLSVYAGTVYGSLTPIDPVRRAMMLNQ